MGKRGSIADAIRSAVSPVVRVRPWWQRIPPEVLEELAELKADHHAGRLAGSRTALAKAISDYLTKHEISTIGVQGVTEWLRNK